MSRPAFPARWTAGYGLTIGEGRASTRPSRHAHGPAPDPIGASGRLDSLGPGWHRARVSAGLPLVLLAGLVAGPSLGPEHATDAPFWWPAGDVSAQVTSADATLVAFTSGEQQFVTFLRAVGADGGLGPLAEPDLMQVTDVVQGPAGVLVVGRGRPLVESVVSHLVDGRTGALLAPSQVVVDASFRAVDSRLSATPDELLLAVTQLEPDGGRRLHVGALGADGHLLDAGLRQVPGSGELLDVQGAHGRHWAALRMHLPDGGQAMMLTTLTSQGALGPATTFPASPPLTTGLAQPQVTATASAVHLTWRGEDGLRQAFVSPQSQVLADEALDAGCASFATAAQGDEVLVACAASSGGSAPASRVVMLRGFPDGGARATSLFAGDGGALEVHGLALAPRPQLTLTRTYAELGRGTWRSTTLVPLSPDGTQVTGPGVGVAWHLASQSAPSLASAGPAGPHALVWYDERLLPEEVALHGLRLSAEGEALAGPVGMPTTPGALPSKVATAGRSVASDGRDFLVIDSDGFDVRTVAWPGDGGPPGPRRALTAQPGLQHRPILAGSPSGYLASWADFTDWTTQRLDAAGIPSDTRFDRLGASSAVDQLWDGRRFRLVVAAAGGARLVDLGPTGPPADGGVLPWGDGGIFQVRLARAGDVLLVAGQRQVTPTRTEVLTLRVAVDGGGVLDDAPRAWGSASPERSVRLWDVGARDGAFYLLGAEDTDAGLKLWTQRLGVDGVVLDPAPVVFDEPLDARNVVAGPALPDGGLLIAYARPHPELSPTAQLVHWRVLSDEGPGAGRDGGPEGRLVVYQAGCGCTGGPGLGPAALLVGLLLQRRPLRRPRREGEGRPATERAAARRSVGVQTPLDVPVR